MYSSDVGGNESEIDSESDPKKICVNVCGSENDCGIYHSKNRSNNHWRDCDFDSHGDVVDGGSDFEIDSENYGPSDPESDCGISDKSYDECDHVTDHVSNFGSDQDVYDVDSGA